MYSTLLKADDKDCFFVFYEDKDDGNPLEIIDGSSPVFASGGRQLEPSFLFAICPNQETRTELYEWIETEMFGLIEPALLERNWKKCECIIDILSECDLFTKVTMRKRKVP